MAKNFKVLLDKMSPAARERAEAKARQMKDDTPWEDTVASVDKAVDDET